MTTEQQRFIEALRDPKYKQTSGKLKRNECFCAEGLKCEIYRQLTGKGSWLTAGSNKDRFSFDNWAWGYNAPTEVDLYFAFPKQHDTSIIKMNDEGMTFPEIADKLEALVS